MTLLLLLGGAGTTATVVQPSGAGWTLYNRPTTYTLDDRATTYTLSNRPTTYTLDDRATTYTLSNRPTTWTLDDRPPPVSPPAPDTVSGH